MKTHLLKFSPENRNNFENIKNGSKSYESRAGNEEYKNIEVGDLIIFSCEAEQVKKIVANALHFKTLDELMQSIPVYKIMPDNPTPEEAKARWLSYPGYAERIKNYGIFVWELKNES